jgi:hypothetical protein
MPSTQWSSVRGTRMRLTRLDDCCSPLAPAATCAFIVSKGFVSVAYSPEIASGDDLELKNANGDICVSASGCDTLKWINLTLSLCNVDPDILNFVTGSPVVLDASGDSVGNRIQTGEACKTNFALEVWTDIPGAVCGTTGAKQYGYFLAPCIGAGILGDWTVENDVMNLQLTAKARAGSGWGVGPWNVVDSALTTPQVPSKLLTAMGPDDILNMQMVTIPPPAETDGCSPMP